MHVLGSIGPIPLLYFRLVVRPDREEAREKLLRGQKTPLSKKKSLGRTVSSKLDADDWTLQLPSHSRYAFQKLTHRLKKP